MLIALSLTTILLTFLFSFFVESAKIEKKMDTTRTIIIRRGHLQTRLQTILTSVDRGSNDPYFYTKKFDKEKTVSLITIFDNGIDPDPAFSGPITGRIYLDQEMNLSLATWPVTKNKNRPWRKEILMPNIKSFEFEFLGKKSAVEHGVKDQSRSINATLSWRFDWAQSTREIPGIIRMTIYEEGSKEPIRFAFILPVSEPFVTYLDKKGSPIQQPSWNLDQIKAQGVDDRGINI